MSGPFDKELESIAAAHTHDFARKLAHEVANLILRRLGIEGSAGATDNTPAAPAAPAKKKAAPAAKSAPKAAPAPAAKAAPSKKAAPAAKSDNAEDRASVVEKVFRLVQGRDGVAVGDVVKATGLARGPATAALKALKQEGRIYMGGSRRFARYAMTQAGADKASESSRKG